MTPDERHFHEATIRALITNTFNRARPGGGALLGDSWIWEIVRQRRGTGELYELGYDLSKVNRDLFRALLAREWDHSRRADAFTYTSHEQRSAFIERSHDDIWHMIIDVCAICEHVQNDPDTAAILDTLVADGNIPQLRAQAIVDTATSVAHPERWNTDSTT